MEFIALLLVAALQVQGPAEAIRIAADSTGSSLTARAGALRTLASHCPREALPLLSRLGQPYQHEWVIWHGALTALSRCPYAELAPFWRDMVTFPRQPVREIALVGLLRTGAHGDVELIREVVHRETDPRMLRLARMADSLLRLPIPSRDVR